MSYCYRAFPGCGPLPRQARREESMKQLRSSRHLIRMWHRREKAAIGHVAGAGAAAPKATSTGTMHSAFTSTGLSIEDQVRKAANRIMGGLALF
jgi:hypothetical protein